MNSEKTEIEIKIIEILSQISDKGPEDRSDNPFWKRYVVPYLDLEILVFIPITTHDTMIRQPSEFLIGIYGKFVCVKFTSIREESHLIDGCISLQNFNFVLAQELDLFIDRFAEIFEVGKMNFLNHLEIRYVNQKFKLDSQKSIDFFIDDLHFSGTFDLDEEKGMVVKVHTLYSPVSGLMALQPFTLSTTDLQGEREDCFNLILKKSMLETNKTKRSSKPNEYHNFTKHRRVEK